MNRPVIPLFVIVALTVLGFVFTSSVLGIFYFLSFPDSAEKANFAIANVVNRKTEPVLHAFYLRSLEDPDKDNDGLEDKIAEKFIYKTSSRRAFSQEEDVNDGQYIYQVYKDAIERGDDKLLKMFRKRSKAHEREDASLEDVFRRRGREIYNIYIGSSLELREPLIQAQKYQAMGRVEESIVFLNTVLEKYPDAPLVQYSIGRAYYKLGEYNKALSMYKGLVDNPAVKSPLLYADIAAANYGLGKEDLFVEYLECSIIEFPEELEQYIVLASYFEKKNRLDEAIDVLNDGLRIEPRYSSFYNLLAIIAGKKNDIRTELALYQKAVAYDFRYTSGHYNLAIIYEENLLDFNSALTELRIAVELDPESLIYKAKLMQIYSRLGMIEESDEIEKGLLQYKNLSAEVYNSIGLKYFYRQEYQQAKEFFLKAAEVSPEMKNAQNNLGNVYALQQQFDLAEQYYKRALEIDPLYANVHHNLGSLFMNRGMQNNYDEKDLREAKKWFEKAMALNPERYDSSQSLGRIYLKLGPDNHEYLLLAEKNLLRSLELKSDEGLSYAELGYVYYNLDEYQKAKENWIRAKSLGIEFPDMDQRLLEISQE